MGFSNKCNRHKHYHRHSKHNHKKKRSYNHNHSPKKISYNGRHYNHYHNNDHRHDHGSYKHDHGHNYRHDHSYVYRHPSLYHNHKHSHNFYTKQIPGDPAVVIYDDHHKNHTLKTLNSNYIHNDHDFHALHNRHSPKCYICLSDYYAGTIDNNYTYDDCCNIKRPTHEKVSIYVPNKECKFYYIDHLLY